MFNIFNPTEQQLERYKQKLIEDGVEERFLTEKDIITEYIDNISFNSIECVEIFYYEIYK